MSDSSTPPSPDSIAEEVTFLGAVTPESQEPESSVQLRRERHKSCPGYKANDHFESYYYDEYDFYNFTPDSKLFTHASGKGRSKREASKHSSRLPSQWGILAKLENEANNRKRHNNVATKPGRRRSISK